MEAVDVDVRAAACAAGRRQPEPARPTRPRRRTASRLTGARPSVSVAGFTLGSGPGWLERKLGLAADSLLSARIVTAAGEQVTASGDEHPDLFWALRGGGPGFGIVTELAFALAPVGPEVVGGMLGWPGERAAENAGAYAALMAVAPDDLGGGLACSTRRRCR